MVLPGPIPDKPWSACELFMGVVRGSCLQLALIGRKCERIRTDESCGVEIRAGLQREGWSAGISGCFCIEASTDSSVNSDSQKMSTMKLFLLTMQNCRPEGTFGQKSFSSSPKHGHSKDKSFFPPCSPNHPFSEQCVHSSTSTKRTPLPQQPLGLLRLTCE